MRFATILAWARPASDVGAFSYSFSTLTEQILLQVPGLPLVHLLMMNWVCVFDRAYALVCHHTCAPVSHRACAPVSDPMLHGDYQKTETYLLLLELFLYVNC